MSLNDKVRKMSGIDVELVKGAGFFGGLLIAKLWAPILSLAWYWYLVAVIVLAAKPLAVMFRN